MGQQKKILILGAHGMLGTVLTKALRANKIFTVMTHSHTANADFNQNLSDFQSVSDLLLMVNADFCINLLALTDVNQCQLEQEKARQLNVNPIRNIVKCVLINNLKLKFIQISTDHVYDHELSTEENIKIVNYYALSKYIGDEISQLIDSVVLRTNFFGASESAKKSFSDWVIQSLVDNKEISGFKDVYFSPLHLSTLIQQIERVILNFHSGVYNLGSRLGLSKYEFIIQLAKHKNLPINLISAVDYNSPQNKMANGIPRPSNMTMDISKFEKIFNTQLPTLIQEIQKC